MELMGLIGRKMEKCIDEINRRRLEGREVDHLREVVAFQMRVLVRLRHSRLARSNPAPA